MFKKWLSKPVKRVREGYEPKPYEHPCAIDKFIQAEFERTGYKPHSVYMVCFCPKCQRVSM
jgi:hypothetical protein